MSLLRWIQGERSPAAAAPPSRTGSATPSPRRSPVAADPRRTPVPAPAPAAVVEELPLAEQELPSAWLPAVRRLRLAAPRPLRRGQRVAVLVMSPGGATIPLAGEVAEVGPKDVQVAIDADRLGAVERILRSLQGLSLQPRARAPRYRITLPAVVSSSTVHALMTTFSLSKGGCGLVWSGPAPARGTMLQLRLGSGSRSAAFHARVCWTSEEGGALRVGLRFVVGQDAALPALLAEARRDGAT